MKKLIVVSGNGLDSYHENNIFSDLFTVDKCYVKIKKKRHS